MYKVAKPIQLLSFQFDDGGRAEAGLRGHTGDCAVRACAIATGVPYKEIYNLFRNPGKSPFAHGSMRHKIHKFLFEHGFMYTDAMTGIGDEPVKFDCSLPEGIIIADFGSHVTCVIDHVAHDIFIPPHPRLIGFWIKKK